MAEPDPPLPELFAAKLAKVAGVPAKAATMTIGKHAVSLDTQVENVVSSPDGRVLAGVRIMWTIDGKRVDALTAGSVGIDKSRRAALDTAAEEWALEYRKPVADALSAQKPDLEGHGYKVYASPLGTRGSKPEGLDSASEAFTRAIKPELVTMFSSQHGLHSMTILVIRSKDGSLESEFRVDGKVSADLKQRAMSIKWPAVDATYMLKQYYVFVPE